MYLRGTMEQRLPCFDGLVSLLYSILALFGTTSPQINYLISKKENMYFILVQPSEKEIQYKYLKSQEIQYKYLKAQENVCIKQIPSKFGKNQLINKKENMYFILVKILGKEIQYKCLESQGECLHKIDSFQIWQELFSKLCLIYE